MDSMFALINRLTAKPGKRAEVVRILLESGERFGGDPACLLYLVSEDAADSDVIWVQDLWTSEEEHAAALTAPELRPYIERTLPLLGGVPVQVQLRIAGGKTPRS
jgi:quinol monooxygenase YgiN